MNKEVIQYLKYGIYNNVLYYPFNKSSIKKYVQQLEPLGNLIKSENPREIIKKLKDEDSNIFITSYVASILDIDDDLYKILLSKIQNRYDMYVLINFLCSQKKYDKKLINKLYQDKIGILGDYKELLFDICSPKTDTLLILKKRNKVLFDIKQKMDIGEVDINILEQIKENRIHPSEIGYYMSYQFDVYVKEKIALYFLEKYGVLEVLPRLDTWFIDFIPTDILNAVEQSIYNIKRIEDVFGLLILYKKINNERIKNVIYQVFTDYCPVKKNKEITIHITPTNRSGFKIDTNEKYDFLYLIGVYSVLLDAEFRSKIYINDRAIEGELMEKLKYFDEHQITLKPSVQPSDEERINILFSNIILPGFDIIWDVTAEKNIDFKNIGPLFVKGRGVDLLNSIFKYINEN